MKQSAAQRPPVQAELSGDARFRILAIDGGGIRGIIPAILLERLETLLEAALNGAGADANAWRERGIAQPRIADCFHLIAGTSTGGLLTAALTIADAGRPKLPASKSVTIYERDGPNIFKRPLPRRILNPFALFRPKYPLEQLRAVLSRPELFGQARLAEACTEVLLTSYDTTNATPRLFTRWGVPGAESRQPKAPELSMVDVALATSAAPTYFDPQSIERAYLVDGGVYAANPVLPAISMALRRTDPPAPINPSELLVISLGTGSWEQPLNYGSGGIVGWLRPHKGGDEALFEAILNGQADSATECAHMILNRGVPSGGQPWWESSLPPRLLGGGPSFWRYQASLPEPMPMDDVNHIKDLKELGMDTARCYEDELASLARMLIAKGPV